MPVLAEWIVAWRFEEAPGSLSLILDGELCLLSRRAFEPALGALERCQRQLGWRSSASTPRAGSPSFWALISDTTTAGHLGTNALLPAGGTFELRFSHPGTFVYYCRFHAHLDGFQPAGGARARRRYPGRQGQLRHADVRRHHGAPEQR